MQTLSRCGLFTFSANGDHKTASYYFSRFILWNRWDRFGGIGAKVGILFLFLSYRFICFIYSDMQLNCIFLSVFHIFWFEIFVPTFHIKFTIFCSSVISIA